MFGVVLWSDRQRNCAVIWCEDHRNLAYFSNDGDAPSGEMLFDIGDLVEFDLREQDDVRLAMSPSLVAERHYPNLADDLLRAGGAQSVPKMPSSSLPGQERGGSLVVPFPKTADRACANGGSARAEGRKFG